MIFVLIADIVILVALTFLSWHFGKWWIILFFPLLMLMEELAWGTYANHSGYVSKANGEFINWLCNAAYRALKGVDDEAPD